MTQGKEKDKDEHARSNARGWSETIAALVAALEMDFDRLEELRDERADLAQAVQDQDARADGEPSEAERALADWDAVNGEELKDLAGTAEYEKGYPFKDADDVRQRIEESPLSVQVRSGWYSPGGHDPANPPEEFEILLSTGGPALRIRGELDEHCQPSRAWLEYQDWGTPWTEFHGEGAASQDDLLTFCSCSQPAVFPVER